MIIEAKLVQDKVTPGAIRFGEVDDNGQPLRGDDSKITQLYIRKSALGGETPAAITVRIETV
jgi:hypothetical protein